MRKSIKNKAHLPQNLSTLNKYLKCTPLKTESQHPAHRQPSENSGIFQFFAKSQVLGVNESHKEGTFKLNIQSL